MSTSASGGKKRPNRKIRILGVELITLNINDLIMFAEDNCDVAFDMRSTCLSLFAKYVEATMDLPEKAVIIAYTDRVIAYLSKDKNVGGLAGATIGEWWLPPSLSLFYFHSHRHTYGCILATAMKEIRGGMTSRRQIRTIAYNMGRTQTRLKELHRQQPQKPMLQVIQKLTGSLVDGPMTLLPVAPVTPASCASVTGMSLS